jgi:hypothetical protein
MKLKLSEHGEHNTFEMEFAYTSGLSINIHVESIINDSCYKPSGKFHLGDGDQKAMLKKGIKLIKHKLGEFKPPMYCLILRWNHIKGIKEPVGVERFPKEKVDAKLICDTI